MKSRVVEIEPVYQFKPFEVVIRVESPAELVSFWARINMHNDTLAAAASKKAAEGRLGPWKREFIELVGATNCPGKKDLYKLLNAKMKECGITRR